MFENARSIALSTALYTMALAGAGMGQAVAEEPELVPRTLPRKSIMASVAPGRDAHTLVLKLRDGGAATARGGRLLGGLAGKLAPGEVDQVLQVLQASPEVRVDPFFSIPAGLLDHLRETGERNTGEALADLTQFFLVQVPSETDPVPLLESLLPIDAVENLYAYRESKPAADQLPPAADLPPTTPDLLDPVLGPGQGYREPAPEGVDIDFAWSQGFRGEGVTVVDIEQNWDVSHEDLDGSAGGFPRGIVPPSDWWDPGPGLTPINHGTATLGVLDAADNDYGVSGLIPGSAVRVMPALRNSVPNWRAPNSVVLAILNMAPGDVLLLELQIPLSATENVPFETFDVEFAVVRQAVALGIHVIEPAGNWPTGRDLDTYSFSTLGGVTFPFDVSERDSGAVMVGAGESMLQGGERDRYVNSNYGTRVDSHAWGQDITTLGYGPWSSSFNCNNRPNPFSDGTPDQHQWYTGCFNGTSGAGAIVAGAAAVLEQMHEEAFGQPMGTRELRNMLRMGTAATLAAAVDEPVGHQPDLRYYQRFLDEGGLITHRFQADLRPSPMSPPLEFGRAVASAGDVDGDGTPDQIVGIPGANSDAGQVKVISGATGRTLRSIDGEAAGDRFGSAVAGGLDHFHDSAPDLVVGAPGAGGGDGEVMVFSGSDTSFPPRTFSRLTPGSAFGSSVAMVPNIDGDGLAEVLVGAPGPMGEASLWSSFGIWLHSFSVSQSDALFGFAVASVGDIDGNGRPDVLIGAPNADDGQSGFPGAAYLYNADDASSTPLRVFGGVVAGGVSASSFFGGAVDGAGDFNGDGRADVIIGAPSWARAGGGVESGKAYVYSGTGSLIRSFTGTQPDGRMGAAVAGLGDFDGDGLDDVAVGRPGAVGSPGRAGRVFVYPFQATSGTGWQPAPSQKVFWRAQDTNLSLLGAALAAAGDVNGDGLADLLVGEPAGELGGRTYVFSSGPGPDPFAGTTRLLADVGTIEATGAPPPSPSRVVFTIDAGPLWAGATYQLMGTTDPVAQSVLDTYLTGDTGTLDGIGRSPASAPPSFGPIPSTTLCPNLIGTEFNFFAVLTLSSSGTTVTSTTLPALVTIITEFSQC